MKETSCVHCKFLYGHGTGYSNYTWMNTDICCAKDMNPKLPAEEPSDWRGPRCDSIKDNWPATRVGRCREFKQGIYICLDVDGEDSAIDYTHDVEQIAYITKHAQRHIINPGHPDTEWVDRHRVDMSISELMLLATALLGEKDEKT